MVGDLVRCCIRMLDTFEFRNHVCMVFPRYAASVYDFLRDNLFYPFPLEQVRAIGQQLLIALGCTWGRPLCLFTRRAPAAPTGLTPLYPHTHTHAHAYAYIRTCTCTLRLLCAHADMHTLELVHTDVKPENIMFVDDDYIMVPSKVRLWAPMPFYVYVRMYVGVLAVSSILGCMNVCAVLTQVSVMALIIQRTSLSISLSLIYLSLSPRGCMYGVGIRARPWGSGAHSRTRPSN